MKPFILSLRAIGTEFAMRLYTPVAIGAGIVTGLIVVGNLWLATQSDLWLWWLLLIPVTILACVVSAVAAVLLLLIRYVRPTQNTTQKQATKQFVNKIQSVTDAIGTPKIILLFRIVRSIAAPSKSSYLSDLVKNRELANDFRELQRLFSVNT